MTAANIEAAVIEAGLQPLPPETIVKFQGYLELLLKWNMRLNLTAIREPEAILHRHLLECIFAAQHLPANIHTLLDFGSGGGFPGIPIALCHPEIQVILGESQGKKAAFLREVIRTLNITNAEVYHGRLEDLDRTFDAVALRAVDKMREACEIAFHKIALEGFFVLFLTEETIQVRSAFDQIEWAKPILFPGSEKRLLCIGQRANVPRGTFEA